MIFIDLGVLMASAKYAERLGGWVILAPDGVFSGSKDRGIVKISVNPDQYEFNHPVTIAIAIDPRRLRKVLRVLRREGRMIVASFDSPGILRMTAGRVETFVRYIELR